MERLRYIKEDFGYTIAFPNGEMGLYSHEVEPYLNDGATYGELMPFKLKSLSIQRDFHLNAPLIVWIELTRRCNLRCNHCFVGAGTAMPNELTTPELYSLLDDLRQMNTLSLTFSGGEPMCHSDFGRILGRACELGFVVSVATNGLLISKERLADFPKGYRDLRVGVSLEGAGDYSALRGKVSFKQLSEKPLLLKDNGILTTVMAAMSSKNIDELRRVFEWCVEHGIAFRSVQFSPIGRGGDDLNHDLLLTPNDVDSASRLWVDETLFEMEINKSIGICVAKIFDYTFQLVYSTRRCKGGRSLAYISADGGVYPCSICVSTGDFKAGNVRDKKFSELWRDSFQTIRSFTWEDFKGCAGCELSGEDYFCTNRCPPLALRYRGNPVACGALPINRLILKRRTLLLREALGCSELKPV
jgi:radical SAM protein with 4Fe4S-binding SPASM domain